MCFFFFQAEDGIRDLVRSRGLGDVYKRQVGLMTFALIAVGSYESTRLPIDAVPDITDNQVLAVSYTHLTLPTIYSV